MLKTLNCSNTALKELGVSQNTNLISLFCNETDVSTLDLTHNANLKHVYANGCKLDRIDVTNNPKLQNIELAYNLFTEMPSFESNQKIAALRLEGNQLDCEDWIRLMQQTVKKSSIQFYPQYNADLSNCMEEIVQRTSNGTVQEMIQQK
jgi:hypothetical protein